MGTFFLAYASCRRGLIHPEFERRPAKRPGLSSRGSMRRSSCCWSATGPRWGWPTAHVEAGSVWGSGRAGRRPFRRRSHQLRVPAVLRVYQIGLAAGEYAYMSRLLLFMGLFSMTVAGLFHVISVISRGCWPTPAVEHMGILIVGLHRRPRAVRNPAAHPHQRLTKGVIFLSSGNIHRAYDSKSTDVVRGAMRACLGPARCSSPAFWRSPVRRPSAPCQ